MNPNQAPLSLSIAAAQQSAGIVINMPSQHLSQSTKQAMADSASGLRAKAPLYELAGYGFLVPCNTAAQEALSGTPWQDLQRVIRIGLQAGARYVKLDAINPLRAH
jgi:hypothetical protein